LSGLCGGFFVNGAFPKLLSLSGHILLVQTMNVRDRQGRHGKRYVKTSEEVGGPHLGKPAIWGPRASR